MLGPPELFNNRFDLHSVSLVKQPAGESFVCYIYHCGFNYAIIRYWVVKTKYFNDMFVHTTEENFFKINKCISYFTVAGAQYKRHNYF